MAAAKEEIHTTAGMSIIQLPEEGNAAGPGVESLAGRFALSPYGEGTVTGRDSDMSLFYNLGKWSPEVSSRGNVYLFFPEVFSGGPLRFLISTNWPHDKEWVVGLSLSFFEESLQASKGESSSILLGVRQGFIHHCPMSTGLR